ncbi:MAG TPA: hypothetical protein QKA08_04315 [Candidatus Megaira endosymbiont of Nemacystus decipiens]|nr:hypothetical protein [Candidatus Megaera endosymbiont of Nemacystus decipiens]
MTINEGTLSLKTSGQNEILVRMNTVNQRLYELDAKVKEKSLKIIEVLGLPAPKNPESLGTEKIISHVQDKLQNMPSPEFQNPNHKYIKDSIIAHYSKLVEEYCKLVYAEAGAGSAVLNLIESAQNDDNGDGADVTGENANNGVEPD